MPLVITLRSVKGSSLTTSEMDTNFSNIKAYVEGLQTQLDARLNTDGSLKDGAVNTTAKLADSIVTLAKLANVGSDNAYKALRVGSDGAIGLGATPFQPFTAYDGTAIHSTGVQSALALSTFSFDNVPAGNVVVMFTAAAHREGGSNAGTIWVKHGTDIVVSCPTHEVDAGGGTDWHSMSGTGVIQNFAGGTLTLDVTFSSEDSTSAIAIGADGGDGRFARKVVLLAGL